MTKQNKIKTVLRVPFKNVYTSLYFQYLTGLENHIRDLKSENEKLRHENSSLRRRLETLQNEVIIAVTMVTFDKGVMFHQ